MTRRRRERGYFPEPVENENEEVIQWQMLARKIADTYWHRYAIYNCHNAYSLDLVYSDALMGLLKAIRTYKEDKGACKSTYYSVCILNGIHNGFRNHGKFFKGGDSVFVGNTQAFEREEEETDKPIKPHKGHIEKMKDRQHDMIVYLNENFSEAEIDSLRWTKMTFKRFHEEDYEGTQHEAQKKFAKFCKDFKI